ncbi:MAG: GNAT family N-acetyltransferase [Thermoanaerobaculia bacterium]
MVELLRELGEEGEEAGDLPIAKLRQDLANPETRHSIFVAVDSAGAIVGVLTLAEVFAVYTQGYHGVINEMYVRPAYRSAGVGASLIDAAVAFGAERGWTRIEVTAPESPRWMRSRRFYEVLGFVFTGPKLKILLPIGGGQQSVG